MQRCERCGYRADDQESICPACGVKLKHAALAEENERRSRVIAEDILKRIDYIDSDRLLNAGLHFYRGIDLQKDIETAKKIFANLILRENCDAMFYLAQILLEEEPENKESAYHLLTKAAKNGHQMSKNLLEELTGEEYKPSGNVSELVEDVMKYVVRIHAKYENDICSCASGFIVTGGYVITNAHVLANDPVAITASFDPEIDDRSYTLKLLAVSQKYDIAVLNFTGLKAEKMEREEQDGTYHPLSFRTENIRRGEQVYTVGNPLGYGLSTSFGVISNPGCTALPEGRWEKIIQTDISSNQGNSGGPLLDMENRVIGMLTFSPGVAVKGEAEHDMYVGASGMSMCVPAEYIDYILSLIEKRSV